MPTFGEGTDLFYVCGPLRAQGGVLSHFDLNKYSNTEIQKGGGNNGEMEEGTWGRTITLINAMESYTMGETVMTQIQRILQIQIQYTNTRTIKIQKQ